MTARHQPDVSHWVPVPNRLYSISSFDRAVKSWLSIESLFLSIWKRAFSLSIEIQSHHQLKAHWWCFCLWFGHILYDSINPSSCLSTLHAWRKIPSMFNSKNLSFHSDIRLKMLPFQTKMRPIKWQWEARRVREPSTLTEQRASQSNLPIDWMTGRFNWLCVFAEFQLKALKIYSTALHIPTAKQSMFVYFARLVSVLMVRLVFRSPS